MLGAWLRFTDWEGEGFDSAHGRVYECALRLMDPEISRSSNDRGLNTNISLWSQPLKLI